MKKELELSKLKVVKFMVAENHVIKFEKISENTWKCYSYNPITGEVISDMGQCTDAHIVSLHATIFSETEIETEEM